MDEPGSSPAKRAHDPLPRIVSVSVSLDLDADEMRVDRTGVPIALAFHMLQCALMGLDGATATPITIINGDSEERIETIVIGDEDD